MVKWLKTRKLNDYNNDNDSVNEPTPDTKVKIPLPSKKIFLKFGFISTMENEKVVPECLMILSGENCIFISSLDRNRTWLYVTVMSDLRSLRAFCKNE